MLNSIKLFLKDASFTFRCLSVIPKITKAGVKKLDVNVSVENRVLTVKPLDRNRDEQKIIREVLSKDRWIFLGDNQWSKR